jgi:hypothetical protein
VDRDNPLRRGIDMEGRGTFGVVVMKKIIDNALMLMFSLIVLMICFYVGFIIYWNMTHPISIAGPFYDQETAGEYIDQLRGMDAEIIAQGNGIYVRYAPYPIHPSKLWGRK